VTRLLLIHWIAISCTAQFPPTSPDRPPSAASTTSQPATQPGEFQPGVRIDWPARCVRVEARVLDVVGPLEFFACGGGKEHESVISLEARATHIFQALGLIGIAPGKPPAWDEGAQRTRPAEGDLVDLRIEWSQSGQRRDVHWTEWVLDAEDLRQPLPLPFVFAGSLMRPDGRLACELSGAAFALVDMPDALLAPIRSRSDRSADLWALPNRPSIPPPGTPVTLVLRAPAPRQFSVSLDLHGDFRVDGRVVSAADTADLLAVAARLGQTSLPILVQGALAADVRRARTCLERNGIAPDAVRFSADAAGRWRLTPSSQPAAP
jgi:hypothetical protein